MYKERTSDKLLKPGMPVISHETIAKDIQYNDALDASAKAVFGGDLEQTIATMKNLALAGRNHQVDEARRNLTNRIYDAGIGEVVTAARRAFEEGDLETARKYTDSAASVQQITQFDKYSSRITLLKSACKHMERE